MRKLPSWATRTRSATRLRQQQALLNISPPRERSPWFFDTQHKTWIWMLERDEIFECQSWDPAPSNGYPSTTISEFWKAHLRPPSGAGWAEYSCSGAHAAHKASKQ